MRTIFLSLLLVAVSAADTRYRICAPKSAEDSHCQTLKGGSSVTCVIVQDSTDCALKIKQGQADFGVFTAEELLVTNKFYPDLKIISELRNKDRLDEEYEFQAVAVVPSNLTAESFKDGTFGALKNFGFCHPGFRQSHTWTDNVLKHFEWKVYPKDCQNNLTVAENEAENLKAFFGKACRPDRWVQDVAISNALKTRYPELCSICTNTTACSYNRTDEDHFGALDCLTSGPNRVAYVALTHVKEYFKENSVIPLNKSINASDYQFLCSDAKLENLTSATPCAWVRQPWDVILAREDIAAGIQGELKPWLEESGGWYGGLQSIILRSHYIAKSWDLLVPSDYLSRGRELNETLSTCGGDIRWCTVSSNEKSKCNWVAAAAATHGIEPRIQCDQVNGTFPCLHRISSGSSDVMTIDSNFGHIARQVFNLSTVLYSVTNSDFDSKVIAVVREGSNNTVTSFSTISKKNACFPEYGGIAWLSFVQAARTNGIIKDSCDYSLELANLLSGACTPGFHDHDHAVINSTTTGSLVSSLCSRCPVEANNASCSANSSNPYYGDKGALDCLTKGGGDFAVIESRNLIEFIIANNINESNFRVLCKNGSLALRTGFNVEDSCALSVTVDSEVVGRMNNTIVKTNDTISALLKMERWLGYAQTPRSPILIHSPFNGTKDLLFKDTSIALETNSSKSTTIQAYIELFSHMEYCKSNEPSGAGIVIASFSVAIISLCVTFFAF